MPAARHRFLAGTRDAQQPLVRFREIFLLLVLLWTGEDPPETHLNTRDAVSFYDRPLHA